MIVSKANNKCKWECKETQIQIMFQIELQMISDCIKLKDLCNNHTRRQREIQYPSTQKIRKARTWILITRNRSRWLMISLKNLIHKSYKHNRLRCAKSCASSGSYSSCICLSLSMASQSFRSKLFHLGDSIELTMLTLRNRTEIQPQIEWIKLNILYRR